ncbi:hypothetical protein COOONC_08467 [Cooperia oncophora]
MLKWSLWWALASCGYFQVGNYVQTLWGTLIKPDSSDVFNGLTEALCPLVCMYFRQYLRKYKQIMTVSFH